MRCRRLKDFGMHAMNFGIKNCQPTQPAGVLDYIKDSLHLVLSFLLCENEAFGHTPSLVAHPQLSILVYG